MCHGLLQRSLSLSVNVSQTLCFSLSEKLGIIDPRLLLEEADSELLTLWAAHFGLQNEVRENQGEAEIKNCSNVDVQTSACERLLLM